MRDIYEAFDRDTLARVCAMKEHKFGETYEMDAYLIDQPAPENYYFYRDHGSNILAVAHLDTVGLPNQREAHFVDTEAGTVVYSRALDDRLGAYIILHLLPALGIQCDILLTVGEESGMSTAAGFTPPPGKRYDWMIEFDRGGTDVVMYQYDDAATRDAVRRSGARVGDGIFSDICYLEHLGVKGFNWGVGYQDYHGPRAHAYLADTFMMVDYFLDFYDDNEGVHMPHDPADVEDEYSGYWGSTPRFNWDEGAFDKYDDDEDLFPESRQIGDDALDQDWIEYPTPEQMRAFEEREEAELRAREEDRMLSEFDR